MNCLFRKINLLLNSFVTVNDFAANKTNNKWSPANMLTSCHVSSWLNTNGKSKQIVCFTGILLQPMFLGAFHTFLWGSVLIFLKVI